MKRVLGIMSFVIAIVILITVGLLLLIPAYRHNAQVAFNKAYVYIVSPDIPFPDIDEKILSPEQIKILEIAHQEYEKHPANYDANVLKYTQGQKQAWCANFISWVMKRAGRKYTNPNSGSWRIPGVLTLREYYEAEGRYEDASSYKPKPGDVAFYIHESTFKLFSTEHVALVIKVDGNTMTTIGGNEGKKMRIDRQTIEAGENNLVGFGRL